MTGIGRMNDRKLIFWWWGNILVLAIWPQYANEIFTDFRDFLILGIEIDWKEARNLVQKCFCATRNDVDLREEEKGFWRTIGAVSGCSCG